MTGFWEVTLGGFIGSSLASTLAAALLLRRNRMLESEIKRQFDERFREFEINSPVEGKLPVPTVGTGGNAT